jgi:DNA-binding CsgD family transcriptional regulator
LILKLSPLADRLMSISVSVEGRRDELAASLLTAGEQSVVDLALSGLSNPAIARKRQSSPRTIANQLASAYKKLGVGSRRELRARLGARGGTPETAENLSGPPYRRARPPAPFGRPCLEPRVRAKRET